VSEQMPLGIDAELYRRAFGQLDGPVHWPSLTADERAARSAEIADWVTELVARFDVEPRVIPACWQRHNGMVEAPCPRCATTSAPPTRTPRPRPAQSTGCAPCAKWSCACTSWRRGPSAPRGPTETPSPARGRAGLRIQGKALPRKTIDRLRTSSDGAPEEGFPV